MRFARCLLFFALGLVPLAALLHRVGPGEESNFDETFAFTDTCQVLFVGSSYIGVGLSPEIFEEETRALGEERRACKFARAALRGYEMRHDLEVLLDHPWPKLEQVVVDVTLGTHTLGFDPENYYNPRLVAWHTWRAMPWLLKYYERKKGGWRGNLPSIRAHLSHLLLRYLGVGRGAAALGQTRIVEGLLGHAPGPEKSNVIERERKPHKQPDAAAYELERQLLIANKQEMKRPRRGDASDAWPRELESVVRRYGYEPIFLYSPVLFDRTPPRLKRRGRAPLLFLDFADPARYPQLYTFDVRGNTSHLNGDGTVLYSKALARELAALPSQP